MKKLILVLSLILLITAVYSSNALAFIFEIDKFEQDNGTTIFTDNFDGEIEPTAPNWGTPNTFGADRQSNGFLELNIEDAYHRENTDGTYESEISVSVINPDYYYNSTSGGTLKGVFEINNGFSTDSYFGIEIANYYLDPQTETPDQAFAGIGSDADGNLFVGWGGTDDIDPTPITGDFSSVTIQLNLTGNIVDVSYDFNSDGSVDLAMAGITTLSFADGDTYTGNFHAGSISETPPIVPEPISSVLFLIGGATLAFRRMKKRVS